MYMVYMHISPEKKVYIGCTGRNPIKRWDYGYGYAANADLFTDIKKYGWDNFEHIILFSGLTKEEAEKREIELIAKYDSANPERGYNKSTGGKSANGYKHKTATKEKIANSLKGKRHTPERRKKQSDAKKRQWGDLEYRSRMSTAHIGKLCGENHPKSKKIQQYDLNGNLLATFSSTGEAARITGIDRRQISACCNGRQKTCRGFRWIHEEE